MSDLKGLNPYHRQLMLDARDAVREADAKSDTVFANELWEARDSRASSNSDFAPEFWAEMQRIKDDPKPKPTKSELRFVKAAVKLAKARSRRLMRVARQAGDRVEAIHDELLRRVEVGLITREGAVSLMEGADPATDQSFIERLGALLGMETRLVPDVNSPKPQWEGLYSFSQAWDDTRYVATLPPYDDLGDGGLHPGSALVAWSAQQSLTNARPVYIGTEQLAALPDETIDPREVQLPFPAMYFDFSSARGPAWIDTEYVPDEVYTLGPDQMGLFGALVTQHPTSTENGNVATNGLTITPYGSSFRRHQEGTTPYERDGVLRSHPEGISAAPIGSVCFGPCPAETSRVIIADVTLNSPNLTAEKSAMAAVIRLDELGAPGGYFVGGTYGGLRVYTSEPQEHPDEIDMEGEGPHGTHAPLRFEAGAVLLAAQQVFKTLYLLEAENVYLGEQKVSRQVRRQAERKNVPISDTVLVRPTSPRRTNYKERGGTRNYSHRFERIGHYNHYTRGRIAKADHLKPCARHDPLTGELTCPDGCRRIWSPPTVVGPEDKPFVPKARVLSGDRPKEER